MLTTRWSLLAPGSFADSMRRELDDSFQQLFGNGPRAFVGNDAHPAAYFAPLTIWEDDGRVYLEIDVPGCDREQLDVTYREGKLWIVGERKVPKDDGHYVHNERLFGRFERAVRLPDTIDPGTIEAELADGILYVALSKKPEAQPTKITVKTANNGRRKRLTSEDKN